MKYIIAQVIKLIHNKELNKLIAISDKGNYIY